MLHCCVSEVNPGFGCFGGKKANISSVYSSIQLLLLCVESTGLIESFSCVGLSYRSGKRNHQSDKL